MGRIRIAVGIAILAALLAAGQPPQAIEPAVADPGTGEVLVEVRQAESSKPPIPFISDTRLQQEGKQDQAVVGAGSPLIGWLAPLAVTSPDGRLVAYSSWVDLVPIDPEASFSEQGLEPGTAVGVPSIRIHDSDTGADTLFETGAYSPAWKSSGAVAYFKGSKESFRIGEPYVGHVMVRESLESEAVQWTAEPGRYVVLGWAGDSLLVYQRHEGNNLDLLALDGPGKQRSLSLNSELIAISEDGGSALVDLESSGSSWGVGLIDVQSGELVSTIPLAGDPGQPVLTSVGYNGSWRGDRAVVSADGGVVVLGTGNGQLSMEGFLRFPEHQGVWEPRLLADGDRFVAWASAAPAGSALSPAFQHLVCSIQARSCEAGEIQYATTYRPVSLPDAIN